MRGKKIDSEFVSNFICECVSAGNNTPDAILARAEKIVSQIDEEIKEIEKKKIYRSKLLDVIATFDRSEKLQKTEDVRILSYFNIQNTQISHHICSLLKKGPCTLDDLGGQYLMADTIFCIKQLLEQKIISKTGKYMLRGDHFDDYLKCVFKEENV